MAYRLLTEKERDYLRTNGCTAEDWNNIRVIEDFVPDNISNVDFYGKIELGVFEKTVEISKGFHKKCGIHNATLRNVKVGNDCLIENIGNYINNYTFGNDCYISNVCTMDATDDATFGEGRIISVLNEIGPGNVILFDGLTSQLAAIMVKYYRDEQFLMKLKGMVKEYIGNIEPGRSIIGNNVKIIDTNEVTNTRINDGCEICGTCRLFNCTIMSTQKAKVTIGSNVICENSIIFDGTSISNSVKLQDCFVGEACQITNGFTAMGSLFFANCYMANGEACAAFCGPFSASHHKSTLLIGGMFSFYNAGSATNFSNHAYKMGPMHYGILERGSKTASGAYLLMPANIGAFSVCFGKLMHHPDTRNIPFSYLRAYGDIMYLAPGRNITTVGLFRDVHKWPKRDIRPKRKLMSIVNFDWLSPFTVSEILKGKQILKNLLNASGARAESYTYHDYLIRRHSLQAGLRNYDMAIKMYLSCEIKKHGTAKPEGVIGEGEWSDLSGLLLPQSEEIKLVEDIKNGTLKNSEEISERFEEINNKYEEYKWKWTYRLILDYYGIEEITEEDEKKILADGDEARNLWFDEIIKDAKKEFDLGDVEPEVLENLMTEISNLRKN